MGSCLSDIVIPGYMLMTLRSVTNKIVPNDSIGFGFDGKLSSASIDSMASFASTFLLAQTQL